MRLRTVIIFGMAGKVRRAPGRVKLFLLPGRSLPSPHLIATGPARLLGLVFEIAAAEVGGITIQTRRVLARTLADRRHRPRILDGRDGEQLEQDIEALPARRVCVTPGRGGCDGRVRS